MNGLLKRLDFRLLRIICYSSRSVTNSDVEPDSSIKRPRFLKLLNWNLVSLNLSLTLLNVTSIFSSFSAAIVISSISSAYLTGLHS